SMLTEMRQAALLQSLHAGPGQWPAAQALAAAARGGAQALGLAHEVGRLLPGHRADLVLLLLDDPRLGLVDASQPASAIVYAAQERHIDAVVLGGEFVVERGNVRGADFAALHAAVAGSLPKVLQRAGLAR